MTFSNDNIADRKKGQVVVGVEMGRDSVTIMGSTRTSFVLLGQLCILTNLSR